MSVSCIMLAQLGREDYIVRAISMFSKQTIVQKELIIIHSDGDKFNEWLLTISKGVNAKVVSHEGTLGSKRNRGVHEASRPWIATFDDDDIHHPDRLAYQLSIVNQSRDVAFTAFSRYIHVFEQKKTAYLLRKDVGGKADRPWLIIEPTLFASRKLILSMGGFSDKNTGEDSDLIDRMFKRLAFVPHPEDSPILFGYNCTGRGVMGDSHHVEIVASSTKLILKDTELDGMLPYLNGYTINCSDGVFLINQEKLYLYY